jgi:hypothetical protein
MAGRQDAGARRGKRYRTPAKIPHPRKPEARARPREEKNKEKNKERGLRGALRNNGLSIALLSCFFVFLAGQSFTGHRYYNQEQLEHGGQTVGYVEYLGSSHFLSATMENWESEFLQMFAYVLMTAFLFQKGSSESKDPEKEREEVDRDPVDARDRPDAPAPVRRGGWTLTLYQNSLSLAFLLLFLLSFGLHFRASFAEHVQEQLEHGGTPLTVAKYVKDSRFWFESFQNWQSEFLAIAAMVLLSIFLRQRGSPESKPVDAPHGETGG